MTQSAREAIFEALDKIKPRPPKERPPRTPQIDLPPDTDGRIEIFEQWLTAVSGVVYRAENDQAVLERLKEIAAEESIGTAITTTDETIAALKLKEWGATNGIDVLETSEFTERDALKQAAFEKADAGITGVDFAVAESGTLGIRHDKNRTRLASLAPPIHIAVVPVDRLTAYYEDAVPAVFAEKDRIPSQLTLITGPSMTGDIAATPVIGMHGPKKLFVIFVG
ncbi:MAG: hypothetical protein GY866_09600 [Proteobacteria bacterium]|nr:hypothetical protein [Pseudomonadota bacterium]